jgi:hypothetical protein
MKPQNTVERPGSSAPNDGMPAADAVAADAGHTDAEPSRDGEEPHRRPLILTIDQLRNL